MTLADLKSKLAMTEYALKHATLFANDNPSSREARAIESSLKLRRLVLAHEIKKQESLSVMINKA